MGGGVGGGGDLLGHIGRVTSGLMMGIFFFLAVTPISLSLSTSGSGSTFLSLSVSGLSGSVGSGLDGLVAGEGTTAAAEEEAEEEEAEEAEATGDDAWRRGPSRAHPLDMRRDAVGEGSSCRLTALALK